MRPLQRISASEQIANELRAQIEAGELRPGDTLPSDTELAARFEVSKPTMTKARAMLVALGLVASRAGAASTVRDAPDPAGHGLQRARASRCVYPDGSYARIVAAGIARASAEVAAALGTEPGSPVIARREVIHAADDTPLATSRTCFPAILIDQCPALLKTEPIPQGTTRYVEQQTGRVAASIAGAVSCRRGGSDRDGDAAQLRLPPDACLLALSTTTYDLNAATIAHEIELHPPDTPIALDVGSR
ncbi:MAG TPA: GntR family transcriptional regulator [Solirubrobacteraceae bacterium]|nr:GntR family transcriptional regulator [Solirubrobacteraceae bacterium]